MQVLSKHAEHASGKNKKKHSTSFRHLTPPKLSKRARVHSWVCDGVCVCVCVRAWLNSFTPFSLSISQNLTLVDHSSYRPHSRSTHKTTTPNSLSRVLREG